MTTRRTTAIQRTAIFVTRVPNYYVYECVEELLQEFENKGFTIRVLAPRTSSGDNQNNNASHRILDLIEPEGHGHIPTILRLMLRALKIIIVRRPAVIISAHTYTSGLMALVSKTFRIPFFFQTLELPDKLTTAKDFGARLERAAYVHANRVITFDNEQANYICQNVGIPKKRILVIPNARRGASHYRRTKGVEANVVDFNCNTVETKVTVLHAGGISPSHQSLELAASTLEWSEDRRLVFHLNTDRSYDSYFLQFEKKISGLAKVSLRREPVSPDKVDRIFNSADIVIAWYDRESLGFRIELAGLSLGKVGRALRNGIPVIVPTLETVTTYVDKYHCGICVDSLAEVNDAISAITSEYQTFSRNALCCWEEVWRPDRHLSELSRSIDSIVLSK